VDDEPAIGNIFGLQLKLAGYEAKSVTSGMEAVELIRKGCFDLVLLDVLMPGMSGTEVIDTVRGFSQIPIILLSAKADISEITKQCGADDHISKPVNPKHLLEKIEGFLGKDGNTPRA